MAAKDPRVQTEEYLRQHKIKELLQLLVSELLYRKPEEPRQFIVDYLEKTKVTGTKPLFNKEDLHTVFDMFDITHRGVVTSQQASNVLTSVLGSAAQQGLELEAPPAALDPGQFVAYVGAAVAQATPLCTSGVAD